MKKIIKIGNLLLLNIFFINCSQNNFNRIGNGYFIKNNNEWVYTNDSLKFCVKFNDTTIDSPIRFFKNKKGKYLLFKTLNREIILNKKNPSKLTIKVNNIKENIALENLNEKLVHGLTFNKITSYKQKEPFLISDIYFNDNKIKNYSAYKYLIKINENTTDIEKQYFNQIIPAYISFSNLDSISDTYFDRFTNSASNIDESIQYQKTSVDSIINAVKNNEILMINEAHHMSNSRYLMGLMLKNLYNNNFRYLAIEGINNDINHLKDINSEIGFYTNNFVYANLLREAKKIGFTLISYDQSGKDRELNAAKTIFEKAIKNNDGKIIIYCGFSHVNEIATQKYPSLANILTNKYKINPFTIDQSYFRKKTGKNNIYLVESNNKKIQTDLTINNSLKIENNCFSLRNSKQFKIDLSKYKNPESVVIYEKTEWDNIKKPLPVFVKLAENKKEIYTNLCVGSYIVFINNIYNETIKQYELMISE